MKCPNWPVCINGERERDRERGAEADGDMARGMAGEEELQSSKVH